MGDLFESLNNYIGFLEFIGLQRVLRRRKFLIGCNYMNWIFGVGRHDYHQLMEETSWYKFMWNKDWP